MTTTERRPGRPPLPKQRIIDAALQIIDEEGADALSLRTLATRLSSGTATLYRHVSGRAELIALVLDQLIGEARDGVGDISELPWDEACRRISTTLFEVLSRHGRAAALLAESVPVGKNALALRETLLTVLLDAGFTSDVAVRAVATLGHYVLGFAMQAEPPGTVAPVLEAETLAQLMDAQNYPNTTAIAQLIPRPLPEEFSFGLRCLLRGLQEQLLPE
ncbi:TetR/AcrR family transcriptional regulator C-terminal domain-containing protein [Arthrobacter sp. ISL-48]|uniref:TetR/AcrR family transcriptional regulator C-terminal domain-containing protein n=1 Tax=Arthrobacter sp. ISL-48 TaxID=2819110 RepID=UPI001BEA1C00|nr:TetR/AcrR family transcriptional regulator C-terminal domain-containing protein [Arthrobacter sp. ISL-48]MBT2534507.1 TetR/AcrR family transcriptional regulator C-terminal domain-containing protein [Arthrobacter sp. ISL-48]